MKTYADPVLCAPPSRLERSDDRDDDVPSGDIELLERLRASDVDDLDADADGDLELLAQLRERDWIGV
jgi:hypothetical protein